MAKGGQKEQALGTDRQTGIENGRSQQRAIPSYFTKYWYLVLPYTLGNKYLSI